MWYLFRSLSVGFVFFHFSRRERLGRYYNLSSIKLFVTLKVASCSAVTCITEYRFQWECIYLSDYGHILSYSQFTPLKMYHFHDEGIAAAEGATWKVSSWVVEIFLYNCEAGRSHFSCLDVQETWRFSISMLTSRCFVYDGIVDLSMLYRIEMNYAIAPSHIRFFWNCCGY